MSMKTRQNIIARYEKQNPDLRPITFCVTFTTFSKTKCASAGKFLLPFATYSTHVICANHIHKYDIIVVC